MVKLGDKLRSRVQNDFREGSDGKSLWVFPLVRRRWNLFKIPEVMALPETVGPHQAWFWAQIQPKCIALHGHACAQVRGGLKTSKVTKHLLC